MTAERVSDRRGFLKSATALAAGSGLRSLSEPPTAQAASVAPASVAPDGYAGPVAFGGTVRPYQQSFWGVPLPDGAAIDPNSAAVVASLAAQAHAPNSPANVNVSAWTAEPTVVPSSQPVVPVRYTGGPGNSAMAAWLASGVPIPPGLRPTPDTDAAVLIYQPGYRNPYNPTGVPPGRIYELERASVLLDGSGQPILDPLGREQWSAASAFRAVGVNTDTKGHPGNWTASGYAWANPGDPDSTYQLVGWGVQGSGLPYTPGVISYADCQRGVIDHAVHLAVVHAAPGHLWPAQKDDGDDPTALVVEGMRFRLAPGYFVGNVHPVCAMLVAAASRHGIVVTDRTAQAGQTGSLGFRMAPSAAPFLNGTPSWQVLNGFPWSQLKLLAAGSDSNPTPT